MAEQLLRLPSVIELTGLSKGEIYRRLARDEFPLPLRLGRRAIAFDANEIQRWLGAQIAERPRVTYRKPLAGSRP